MSTKGKIYNKLLSMLLAFMILVLSAPVTFAAEKIELSEDNITEYPTVSNSAYYGQVISEAISLVGGVVKYNDTEVKGKFVFTDSTETVPSSGGLARTNFSFIPENEEEYNGFSVERSRKVRYDALVADLEFVNENDFPVASSIDAGQKLSESTISGGQVQNKYNPAMQDALEATWSWVNPETVVEESNYYEAKISLPNYNTLTYNIYVDVKGKVVVPEIEITPIEIEYDPNITYASLSFVGTKAIDSSTGDEVTGTFSFVDVASSTPKLGYGEPLVKFTPDDLESYASAEFRMPITVKQGTIKFTDETGNKIVPELTMPYGTKLNSDFANTLAKSVNIGENVWIYYRDIDGNEYDYSGTTPGLGTHTYKVTAIPYNPSTSNYKATELEFKLTIEPLEVTPNLTARGNDKYMITTGDYKISPRGLYDLYVDGELAIEDIKHQEEFTWRPEKSGTYDLKAVYTPIENDTYKVNDAVREDYVKNLTWEINCTNCTARAYAYGEKAMVSHMLGDKFAGWVFYDENGNEFTPENMEEYSSYVYFTMPDFSFSVRAKIVGEVDDSVDNDDNSGSGSAGLTSIFGRFIEFLRNLFEKYINIFKTIFGMFAPAN